MLTVRVEHGVPSYEAWKQVFDGDPVGREKSGVRRYQIAREADDPNFVVIDLDFQTRDEADAFLRQMRMLWDQVDGTLITGLQVRVVETMETKEY